MFIAILTAVITGIPAIAGAVVSIINAANSKSHANAAEAHAQTAARAAGVKI